MKRTIFIILIVIFSASCSDDGTSEPDCVTNEDCPVGKACIGGECREDPCIGMACDDPPDSHCEDANTVRIYTSPGTCFEGECEYPHQDIGCENGCESGLCKDCVPDWVDVTACDCTPSECAGCDGNKQQSDGCGNTRDASCHLDATGCGTLCCAGTCCQAGQVCHNAACCSADCANKDCGPDGCGGSCGDCPQGQNCNVQGTCESGCDDCPGEGEVMCMSDTEIAVCTDWDFDGCLEWLHDQTCIDAICQSGVCVCFDACFGNGARECISSTSWRECDDWDGDGCLEWGIEQSCGSGETCEMGSCMSACGCGSGEACIDDKCAPVGILLAREGSASASLWCPMGYQEVGRWQTGPGIIDANVEGIDFHRYKIDAGWVWVCSADPARVSVVNTQDDCAANTSNCSGQIRGEWHVGNACGGPAQGVDVNGRSLETGWMGLCVAAGTDAKVETGHNDCGASGPGCGTFRSMGNWHTNPTACDSDDTGRGDSGRAITTGWMLLCTDSQSFPPVDTSTLTGKIVTGYQGWFAAPGDGSQRNAWVHWFRTQDPVPANATFDLWPDLSELDADELFNTGMQYSDGSNAALFSSYTQKTVKRHIKWMAQYGIDAAFLQRFNCELSGGGLEHRDQVARSVMAGAEEYNRAFIIMYDISGADAGTLVGNFKNDWMHLVDDLGVTQSPAYLHHHGRPLVAIWGFGFTDRPGTPQDALEMIDFFHNNPTPRYRATVMGGVPTNWRTGTGDSQPGYDTAYRSFDVISPWSVGRYNSESGVVNFNTNYIRPDLTEAADAGADYMPVVWPGFSWANLRQDPAIFNNIPRNGGSFFNKQFYEAQSSGCTQVYIAMFDEVDESTAIFKAVATQGELPTTGQFLALDQDGIGVPNDWYLRLAGASWKMLIGQTPLSSALPVK